MTLPKHVAIIMDGNGRWAQEQGLPRAEGHRRGAETIDLIVEHAHDRGIANLTLYAFSEENWSRPIEEVVELINAPEVSDSKGDVLSFLDFLADSKIKTEISDIVKTTTQEITSEFPEVDIDTLKSNDIKKIVEQTSVQARIN